jgi:2-methylcitrate dehydratase PrpD
VVALRERVVAHVRPGVREDEAHVTLTLRDGSRREVHVDHALGSLQRPMSDEDLSAKFRELADGVLPADRVEAALQLCWRVDTPARAEAFIAALSP